ncbi:glycolate oxidase subunit GlcE [Imhoffiella purpurea]|uniref:Glycolate dehydrogenase, FAD-binding subunit GlcE n=1 Tax=Imhoffiella purpurea TaxID=1249627 RepID=W9V7G3_9GAMM|nr:glycolate oxidase subunit GlcE [Imhoffiella purpurea]EXJ15513.1 Glycolate dehydrogenase, FAD-binding subunit GlcE [Imhoffiella purpurea]
MSKDSTTLFQERVKTAIAEASPVAILGNGTKSFYGRIAQGQPLRVSEHAGILNYQPKELVLTARAGTTLDEIEDALARQGQSLAFEPPHFRPSGDAPDATLGGTLACGLAGPARPYAGAARDLVLGVRILTGRAEVLRFGGEVMKNVAGYDVSRLMAGAMGTLGILLDISLKVMPRPAISETRILSAGIEQALDLMIDWAAKPWPVTATAWYAGRLWVRLSGGRQGVSEAAQRIGGEVMDPHEAETFWRDLIREQGHRFFSGEGPLWRLSLPANVPHLALAGDQLIEWSGSQRWLRGDADAERIRGAVSAVGGHATLFRGGDRAGHVFHPLSEPLMRLHLRLKQSFDPHGILNPGRLYAEF